ncbi:MAG: I78 family peptidase inhibitor [Pseudomonadota bacterium]
MARFVTFLMMAFLVGCGGVAPPSVPTRPAVPPLDQNACDGAQFADLIGQDATALEQVLIMRPVRVIRPLTAISMDFRPDRLNFEIDATNRVARIYCG